MKSSQRTSNSRRLHDLADAMITSAGKTSVPVSVAGFARAAGINRSTLYSSYPDIVRKINGVGTGGPRVRQGRKRDEALAALRAELSIARRQRRAAIDLRDLYALQIRILTDEVQKLTKELEARVGIRVITPGQGSHDR